MRPTRVPPCAKGRSDAVRSCEVGTKSGTKCPLVAQPHEFALEPREQRLNHPCDSPRRPASSFTEAPELIGQATFTSVQALSSVRLLQFGVSDIVVSTVEADGSVLPPCSRRQSIAWS